MTVSDLIGRIKSSQVEIAASLAHGNASDFSAYQRLVGRYQGLQEAMDILNDLLKEKDDDE
jgi:hypothetical protein